MADDLRRRFAEAIRSAADFSIVGEWICCDPVNPDHDLCVKGDVARQMLAAVLADDPERLFVPSKLVDAVMAVRDEEMERLRVEIEADDKAISELNTSVTLLEKRAAGWRGRAEKAEAAIARVRQEHAAIHAAMDAFAATHEPACECEVIPATRETADRMLAALDALPERTKNA